MGWFSSSNEYENMDDLSVGLQALQFFYNKAKSYSPNYTYNEMIEKIKMVRGGESQIRGLGLGIKLIPMKKDAVIDAMESLAIATKGHLPANISVFRDALTKEANSLSFSSFLDQVVVKSATDIGSGLVKVGETTLTVAKGVGSGAEFWAKYSKVAMPITFMAVLGAGYLYYKKMFKF